MKYFIDTEFLEGTQDKTIFGIKYSKTKPTIDLISIALVSEDGREYYAISKDFNLKEAWNRYEIEEGYNSGDIRNTIGDKWQKKVYWIRDNVLKPIFDEWKKEANAKIVRLGLPIHLNERKFNYKNFKYCIKCIGKTNKQIAEEIKEFTRPVQNMNKTIPDYLQFPEQFKIDYSEPKFYGYYSDYDWVVFCWLFGKMMDLPKEFPMYCIDLKQILDEKIKKSWEDVEMSTWGHDGIENITKLPNYPKQTNEHNALADAKWNFELYKFLEQL